MGRIDKLLPPMLMAVSQLILAGVSIVYKFAANDGMDLKVLVAYRNMFGAVAIIPFALIIEKESLAKINAKVLFQAFLCGFFWVSLGQNLFLQSLVYTSATFMSAIINLIPAVTFILAIFLKLEKLALGTMAGKAKVMGTWIGIGGAMLFTFYKGPEIWAPHINLMPQHGASAASSSHGSGKFLLGAFLGLLTCISLSAWMIVQAKMNKQFPYSYSVTALACIMGSIQAAVFALCVQRDWSQWKLGWNIRLLAVAYSGILGSGLMAFLMACAIRLKGPLYASIFNPLSLVFVAIGGCLMLGEELYLGSILGGILIVCGLYLVLWGKSKEAKQSTQLAPTIPNECEGMEKTDITQNKEVP